MSFAGISVNIEALWAKLVKRRGGVAVEGPPQKKSKDGYALVPSPQALVVDLAVLRTIGW